ncbi:DUF6049 family protein [uncultured Microbacterium sp.]|uniref:DUF6049 family protein n=1 Tax=uncultured Microbacterium sp. TaxID=191216 RepID=UPI0035C97D84
MTVTPARTPARPRALAWARGVGAVAAVILLLGSGAWAASAAGGPSIAEASPSPTPSATGRVDLTLSPAANGIVRAGDGLTASMTIENGTPATLAAPRVTLILGDTALPDRAALTSWLDSAGGAPGTLTAIGQVDLPAVDSDSSETRTLSVASTDAALANRAPGVYPLIASYTDASGTVSSASAMIVPDAAATATGIGVVVPITAPAIGAGLLSAAELTDLTAPDGSLSSQLDAAAGTTAILAVDPAVPAAIRVLGTAAPARALAWLARLESLPNSRFALQFGDADVAAQLEAGLPAPESPTSLQAYMSAPDFATASGTASGTGTGSTPSPTSTTGPDYPSLDELLDIGGGRADIFWPAGGTTTAGVLGALAANTPQSVTLLPSGTLAAGATGSTVPAHATADGADVLAYDSDVSSALHAASLIDTAALRGAPLTAATAYLAFAAKDAGGRPLLVTVDRGSGRSTLALSAAISAAQAPGLSAVGFEALTNAPAQSTGSVVSAGEPVRPDAASTLFAGEARIAPFATILDDPSVLTGRQRAEALQLLGNAWRDSPDDWQTALSANQTATAATLGAVGILAPTTIQLLSPQTPLQFWVRNDLPYPANVVLHATGDDLRVDVQPQTTVTGASPRSNTRVEVPLTAHVRNAQMSVDLQLRSPTGEPIGTPERADITVRADWEGIALTSLLVIIGALVVFGLVRTIHRRRRARRDAATDARTDPPRAS